MDGSEPKSAQRPALARPFQRLVWANHLSQWTPGGVSPGGRKTCGLLLLLMQHEAHPRT